MRYLKYIKIFFTYFLPKKIICNIENIYHFLTKWKNTSNKIKFQKAQNYIERFREIISDPINILIERVPEAGYLNSKMEVTLHNGNLVPINSFNSYNGIFSDILVLNRGVHEPLEEFCFQELIKIPKNKKPLMIELGAYWGHYSMWFKKKIPNSKCILIEPDRINLEVGKKNFANNKLEAEFINQFVSTDSFTIDKFLINRSIKNIFLLHSDIQGYEIQMLKNCKLALSDGLIDYLMISTHSQTIHKSCLREILQYNYLVDVNSDFKEHTTSGDGFIFARHKKCKSPFKNINFLGRIDILRTNCKQKLNNIKKIQSKRY